MKNCKHYKKLFVEALYNELAVQKEEQLKDHLQSCSECSEEFEQMKQTLDTMQTNIVSDPGNMFWDEFFQNVESRLSKADQTTGNSATETKEPSVSRKYIYPVLRIAAILVVGFMMGYIYFYADLQNGQPDYSQTRVKTDPNMKMVAQRTNEYLEDAKVIILGIVNLDSDNVDPASLDFSRQQEYSRQLVQRAAVLKNDLAGTENKRVLGLISELEMILMQIANYESKMDLDAVDLIKSGVDNQAILLKINLEKLMLSASDNEQISKEDQNKRKDI